MNNMTQQAPKITFDPLKLTNAQQHAEHLRAHADFLTERQRASGIRARLCSTGCYSLYDAEGHYIGRTAPPLSLCCLGATKLATAAVRMAHSEELVGACRDADADYEEAGAVSPATIARIRALLLVPGMIEA
jgi:hypothetical protein